MLLDPKETTRKHERDGNIETNCGGEVSAKMRQEGIIAAGDQRACVWRSNNRSACCDTVLDPVLPERLGDPTCQIVRLARDDPPDTAARLVDVPSVPWNDVNVQMEDRLPGRLADVDADVVAIGCVPILDGLPCVFDSNEQFSAFGIRSIEPCGDVSGRD